MGELGLGPRETDPGEGRGSCLGWPLPWHGREGTSFPRCRAAWPGCPPFGGSRWSLLLALSAPGLDSGTGGLGKVRLGLCPEHVAHLQPRCTLAPQQCLCLDPWPAGCCTVGVLGPGAVGLPTSFAGEGLHPGLKAALSPLAPSPTFNLRGVPTASSVRLTWFWGPSLAGPWLHRMHS